jgi:hypothetical protein
MKPALRVLICVAVLAFQAQPASPAEPARPAVFAGDGVEVRLTERENLTIKFWLQQLVLSALYRNVVQESSLDEWERHVNVVPRISGEYPPGTKLAIPEKQTLEFEQLLLPLPGARSPDYIYLRQGTRVLRVAKYDPWVLQKLLVESGLAPPEKLTAPRTLF